MSDYRYYYQSLEELEKEFNTNLEQGLNSIDLPKKYLSEIWL